MNNNGFSKLAVEKIKSSEEFSKMSGTEHLILCIEERSNNYNRFLAHADAVLGWHRTRNAVKFIMDTMHGFYGYLYQSRTSRTAYGQPLLTVCAPVFHLRSLVPTFQTLHQWQISTVTG